MSKATQVSQKEPNGQNPAISVTAFQGITKMATNRSDTASEITKKLVTLERRWRNLVTAAQTRVFPSKVVRMSSERKQPVRTRLDGASSKNPLSMTVVKFMGSIPESECVLGEEGVLCLCHTEESCYILSTSFYEAPVLHYCEKSPSVYRLINHERWDISGKCSLGQSFALWPCKIDLTSSELHWWRGSCTLIPQCSGVVTDSLLLVLF